MEMCNANLGTIESIGMLDHDYTKYLRAGVIVSGTIPLLVGEMHRKKSSNCHIKALLHRSS